MTNLRSDLVQSLKELGVEERPWPGRDDGFSSLLCKGKEFAHFHSGNELDLRLGRDLIEREGLSHPSDSTVHPNRSKNSHWIEVRFSRPEDLAEVIRLVTLALKGASMRSHRRSNP